MKRSEAIFLIENATGYSKKESENILKVVQEAVGMLPPPTQLDPVTSYLVYCYYPKVEEYMDSNGFEKLDTTNSQLWEPEDEEK